MKQGPGGQTSLSEATRAACSWGLLLQSGYYNSNTEKMYHSDLHTFSPSTLSPYSLCACRSPGSTIQISATPSSYFPQYQSCLQTKLQTNLQDAIIQQFITELRDQQITGAPMNASLICERQLVQPTRPPQPQEQFQKPL